METNKTALIVFIAVILALLLVMPWGGMIGWNNNYRYGSMMGMMYNYGFSGMWIFGWLFMVVVLIAIVLLIIWLMQQIHKPQDYRRRR